MSTAAVIRLDACPALHYSALQILGTSAGAIMEKTAQTTIRMTTAEREAWEAAAKADGRTLSAWIVRRCNGEPTIAPVFEVPRAARKPRPKRKAR